MSKDIIQIEQKSKGTLHLDVENVSNLLKVNIIIIL
jgi:hypothetical protein